MRLLGKVLYVMIYLVCYLSELSQAWSYHRSSAASHLNRGFDNFISPSTKDVHQNHTTVSSVMRKKTYQRTLDYGKSVSTTESAPIIVFPEAETQNRETSEGPAMQEVTTDDPNRNIFQAPKKQCPPGELLNKSGNCSVSF